VRVARKSRPIAADERPVTSIIPANGLRGQAA